MIITTLNQLGNYTSLSFLSEIASFLESHDITKFAEGDYEIRGRDLFYRVLRYMPKVSSEVRLETHSVYTDVQILLEGMEIIPVALFDDLIPTGTYDSVNDVQFFYAKKYIAEITFQPKMLAVFLPGDSHASKQCNGHTTQVKKLVFKVRK